MARRRSEEEETHSIDHGLLDEQGDGTVENVALGRYRAGLEPLENRFDDFEEGGYGDRPYQRAHGAEERREEK